MASVIWDPLDAMPNEREFEGYHVVNEDHYGMSAFHAHYYYEFFIYLAGSINIAVEEKLYTPEPYTLFLYPPGVMHRWTPKGNPGRYERMYVYVSREYIESLSTPEFPMANMLDEAAAAHRYSYQLGYQTGIAMTTLIDELVQSYKSTDTADILMNRCRVYMLLISICRQLRSDAEAASALPDRLRDIVAYINEHVTEPLSLDQLTERFLVSKYYLLHAFKDYASMSVHQYIISKRISHAKNLLHGGMSPGSAAQASGFNDYAGFYRAFVKQVGITPQAFCKGQAHRFFHPAKDE